MCEEDTVCFDYLVPGSIRLDRRLIEEEEKKKRKRCGHSRYVRAHREGKRRRKKGV